MSRVNLLKLRIVYEPYCLFTVPLNIAGDISLNRARSYFFDNSSAELFKEHIKRAVKAEAILKCNFCFHGIRLSKEVHILLKLVHIIYRELVCRFWTSY